MSATELPICNAPTVKYRLLSWGEGKNLIDKKNFRFPQIYDPRPGCFARPHSFPSSVY